MLELFEKRTVIHDFYPSSFGYIFLYFHFIFLHFRILKKNNLEIISLKSVFSFIRNPFLPLSLKSSIKKHRKNIKKNDSVRHFATKMPKDIGEFENCLLLFDGPWNEKSNIPGPPRGGVVEDNIFATLWYIYSLFRDVFFSILSSWLF